MSATDRAHEIDDRHDHKPWRDHLRAERYLSAALSVHDACASRDHYKKECAPAFRE